MMSVSMFDNFMMSEPVVQKVRGLHGHIEQILGYIGEGEHGFSFVVLDT